MVNDKLPPLSEDADLNANNIVDKEDIVLVNKKSKPQRSSNRTSETPVGLSEGPKNVNVNVNTTLPSSFSAQSSNYNTPMGAGSVANSNNTQPINPEVALAQLNLDRLLLEQQLKINDSQWMKTYWRPAMGWLYMVICFMDFVGFPLLTIFLPIIFKPFGFTVPYQAWQSLTLANGGLIHLAFGTILGAAAWTRGMEKIAGKS